MRFLVYMICAAFGAVAAEAQDTYAPEAVKAAFLHRFASYVQWPEGAIDSRAFTIGVVGDGKVAEQLTHLLPGLRIQESRAQVRTVREAEELEGVHILYMGPHTLARSRGVLLAATKRPILIVTDEVGGLENGGIINFVQIKRNIRFEISLSAAERSRLRIDSGLLSVAARVEGQPRINRRQQRVFLARAARATLK